MRKYASLLLAVLAIALVAAGCGDSDKSDTSGDGGTTAATTSTTTAAKPTGEPIKVMSIGLDKIPQVNVSRPFARQAPLIRAESINNAGGINGRPIEMIFCDIQNDPNREMACARQAIKEHVVAIAGCNCPYSANTFPLFEKAGIPVIGSLAQSVDQLRSPISFPIVAGLPGLFAGLPRVLGAQGAKKFGYVHVDLGEATAQTFPYVDEGIKAAGMTSVGRTGVAPDATDFGPSIAAAARTKPDGLGMFFAGDTAATFLQQAKQQMPDMKFATVDGVLTKSAIDSLGATAEGVYVVEQLPTLDSDVPGMQEFKADMDAFSQPIKGDVDQVSTSVWLSVWLFGKVAATLPKDDITSKTVLAAMGKLHDFDMGGMTPPLTTDVPATSVPDAPRYFNPSVIYGKIEGGKTVMIDGEFVDPFAAG